MKMPEWWRVRPGKRTLAALLVLILLAMVIYGGWRASGAADVSPAGQTWQVHREDVDQQLALVGVVESARVIQLTAPFDGVVSYQGRPVSFGRGAEMAQRAAGRPIGFVFQQFNLIPSLSVLDNVALPLLYQGLAPAVRAAQSLAVLETLGIADKAGQRPDDLSHRAAGADRRA